MAKPELRAARVADTILILSGDHIYEMDYDVLINFHMEKGPTRLSAPSACRWTKRTATVSWTWTTSTTSQFPGKAFQPAQ